MDECQFEIIKLAVRAALQEELQKGGYHMKCPLEEVGINAEEHKLHHRTLKCLGDDWSKLRIAFLLGVVTVLTGGLAAVVWMGLKVNLIMK